MRQRKTVNADFSDSLVFALCFALAAGAGALLRYVLSTGLQKIYGKTFPLGLFVVNVLGCFGFGAFVELTKNIQSDIFIFSENLKIIIFTAFFGSFTTFSTLIFEADIFLKNKKYLQLSIHLFGQIAVGFMAFASAKFIFFQI